ncbi:MAG: CDP-alcohol phosphatidyltransferase family protein [Rhodobiaceae bacterium]|nr:CDP-alcohol phosphatidyltransferase family protein [Rhodobiaceae bacterium]MCC0054629.1 CDP-alcohol phosphatidyltransferase family protein [Rhodobiaceae bacterium]
MWEHARRGYRRVLELASNGLARTGVSPNMLTVTSLVPAILAGWAAAGGQFLTAGLLLLLSGVFDLLDGSLARNHGKASRFGALLDSTIDRICDGMVPVGLVLFHGSNTFTAAIAALSILTGYTIPYIRARALSLDIILPRLWMRREDRLLSLSAALLLDGAGVTNGMSAGGLVLIVLCAHVVLGATAAVVALSAARRSGQD